MKHVWRSVYKITDLSLPDALREAKRQASMHHPDTNIADMMTPSFRRYRHGFAITVIGRPHE